MPAMEHYFKRLIEIGIELSREKDPDRLLETILEAAQDIGNADAGTLFIRDVNVLRFAIIRNDSLEFAAGGTAGVEVDLPPLRLFEGGEPNVRDVACFCALQGETVNVPDVYEDPSFDFSGAMRFDELAQYRTQGLLTVPIKTDEGQVLGVVQLTNSHNPDTSEFAPFTDEFVSFVETIAMQAAVALQNLLERNRLLAPVTVSASRGQPSVFVSHASANNLQIEADVLPVLEEAGIGYWYSRASIRSAAEWERSIQVGLQQSEKFLLVMTRDSLESEWVRDELFWAIDNRPDAIIPLLLDDCEPGSFHIRLRRTQTVDFGAVGGRAKLLEALRTDQ